MDEIVLEKRIAAKWNSSNALLFKKDDVLEYPSIETIEQSVVQQLQERKKHLQSAFGEQNEPMLHRAQVQRKGTLLNWGSIMILIVGMVLIVIVYKYCSVRRALPKDRKNTLFKILPNHKNKTKKINKQSRRRKNESISYDNGHSKGMWSRRDISKIQRSLIGY